MDKKTNFLIGRAERLLVPIKVRTGFGDSKPVYELEEAKTRLADQIMVVTENVMALEDGVCPGGLAVAKFQINPSYIARSYFPKKLLRHLEMSSIGSRTVKIRPEKWKRKGAPELTETTQLFVSGKRESFAALSHNISELVEETPEAMEFARIEWLESFDGDEKLIGEIEPKNQYFEVCLHLVDNVELSEQIVYAFEEFAQKLDVELYDEYQFAAGNLWFVPVFGDKEKVANLSRFSMVRLIRAMPKLRGIRPLTRGPSIGVDCVLPDAEPVSNEISVALLDGGIPSNHNIDRWIDGYVKFNPAADDDADGNAHGLAVASAFLFGPIQPGVEVNRPYAPITKIRVLDSETDNDDSLELYQTLGHIEEILESAQFEYINLSMGPDMPVEDDDVHAWTSVIDSHLSDGRTFMAIAAGNNGDRDQASGNARVQVPSDCINATAVGASDSDGGQWGRAFYSAVGPGRRPGVIKPDLVAFGGSPTEYFHVLTDGRKPQIVPNMGTSFASPYLLRQAVGIRATLGKDITPLVARALLIHSCEQSETAGPQQIGWGRIPPNLNDIITSPEGIARIVYQGELTPSKYVRAPIPVPDYVLKGKVKIKATLCYTCDTDPQDSASYSKAGLEIAFRPHRGKTHKSADGKTDIVNTRSFFSQIDYATEDERRKYSQKWETTLHATDTMLGRSLDRPNFEIHYVARESGGDPRFPRKIRYALILSIESKHHLDLYSDILENYAQILMPIQPRVEIPIQV